VAPSATLAEVPLPPGTTLEHAESLQIRNETVPLSPVALKTAWSVDDFVRAPAAGDESVGVDGGTRSSVKLRDADQPDVPPT
jgi:hypothetical protein